jgi:hypothetical protein
MGPDHDPLVETTDQGPDLPVENTTPENVEKSGSSAPYALVSRA